MCSGPRSLPDGNILAALAACSQKHNRGNSLEITEMAYFSIPSRNPVYSDSQPFLYVSLKNKAMGTCDLLSQGGLKCIPVYYIPL